MHLFTDDINSAGYQHHQKTSMRGKASTRRKDVRGKEREEIVVVPMRERKVARHNDIDGIKDTTRDGANH
ncbi:hypothetical protein WN943_006106 [Citrus x changshan-huyou]